jgi:hypothetical protein
VLVGAQIEEGDAARGCTTGRFVAGVDRCARPRYATLCVELGEAFDE